MKKIVRLTESDLTRLVKRVIKEQQSLANQYGSSYQKANTNAYASAAAGKQAVKQFAAKGLTELMNAGKMTMITIGKVIFYTIVINGVVIWLIGKGVYKIGQALSNAMIKLLSSTKKIVVGTVTALNDAVMTTMRNAKIQVDKGLQFVTGQLNNLKDSTVSLCKWALSQMKQFGYKIYASVLMGATKIKELASALGSWLGGQWDTIKNQIGKTWDEAKAYATGAYNQVKSKVAGAVDTVKNAASNVAGGIAKGVGNIAGNVTGFLGGLMSEMFERYFSFKGSSSLDILMESRKFNNKSIL